jgi:hypothetical protein
MKPFRFMSIFFLTLLVLLFTAESMAQLQREDQRWIQLNKQRTLQMQIPQTIEGPPLTSEGPPLAFTTTSPLPAAVVGGTYNYQIQVSGGTPPFKFCPMYIPGDGTSPRCDNHPGQQFSMPAGLTLSSQGLITGQVKCVNPSKPDCGVAGYQPILIFVQDSDPKVIQSISQEFWIDIKRQP